MGEVYRARDMRLKREVAIKVLPHEFTTDHALRQVCRDGFAPDVRGAFNAPQRPSQAP